MPLAVSPCAVARRRPGADALLWCSLVSGLGAATAPPASSRSMNGWSESQAGLTCGTWSIKNSSLNLFSWECQCHGNRAGREERNSMDLVKRREEYRDRERVLTWEGTFKDYFELVTRQPQVAQLSHERIYNMITAAGTETNRVGEPRYKFFAEEIFGIEKPLQQIVEYFHSAAQRLEVRKRILLLMGPVGGGKSTIVALLKRGLEAYSRAEAGAAYSLKECPMHEEPLHLIPQDLREDVEKEFGL